MTRVTIEKTAIKQAHCEHCNCLYAYQTSRKASRSSDGALAAGHVGGVVGVLIWALVRSLSKNDDSKLRAQAEIAAQKQIDRAIEVVPCPECGWYQQDMVKEARRRARRDRLMMTFISFGSLAAFALFIMAAINDDKYSRKPIVPHSALWIAGSVVAICTALYVLRWVHLGNYDVNAGFPTRRPPYKGAPQPTKSAAVLPAADTRGAVH